MVHESGNGRAFRALFVYPAFTSQSFWNYRATCEITGAKYPAIPLGLLTVAAMLPHTWDIRLIDENVATLTDDDIRWADLLFSGGMLPQQPAHLKVIDRARALGRKTVVGGTDATSSPQIYDRADYLVLNEAEVTLPRFLEALAQGGEPEHIYTSKDQADVTTTPIPRYDLIDFDNYLHVGVQYARGCPFNCEFCDIIELFGRRPRVKNPEQILAELDRLYELGYRGHVDFVDDNFIGNKRTVKELLPRVTQWLKDHKYPFEFSTEASINLAHDDELLGLMQDANFSTIFVGIESPDEETLRHMQKNQNTRGSLAEHCEKIYRHGIFINAGFIIGFDSERDNTADGLIRCVEETAVPVPMAGLLTALPNTQLTRRLRSEGRLFEHFDLADMQAGQGDQCTAGLNFITKRPRADILSDYRRTIAAVFEKRAYFGRTRRVVGMLNQKKKKVRLPWRYWKKDVRSLRRLIWVQGVRSNYKWQFWKTFFHALFTSPRSFKYAIVLSALYAHFGPFSDYLVEQIDAQIAAELANPGKSYEDVLAEREADAACDASEDAKLTAPVGATGSASPAPAAS